MAYIGRGLPHLRSNTEFAFTATAGQTVFTGLTYTPGFLEVFHNGRKIRAFTATNGTTFTLTNACTVGDEVVAVAQANFHVVGAYLKTEADTLFAKADGSNVATPPQFDNDMSLVNSAFVQRALGSIRDIVAYTTSQAISAAHVGKLVLPNSAGAITLTLPLASSLVVGAAIHFRNAGVGLASLVCSGADIFYRAGLSSPFSTLKLSESDSVSLVVTTNGWELLAGSAALRAASGDFGSSLSASGYQKLPSGLIIQWGSNSVPANATGDETNGSGWDFTLPISFPNAAGQAVASFTNPNAGTTGAEVSASKIYLKNSYAGAQIVRWFAIGY